MASKSNLAGSARSDERAAPDADEPFYDPLAYPDPPSNGSGPEAGQAVEIDQDQESEEDRDTGPPDDDVDDVEDVKLPPCVTGDLDWEPSDLTGNVYQSRRKLEEAGDGDLLRNPSDPADPWTDPDKVIDVAEWNRRRPESVVPGGELQNVERTDRIVTYWRKAALDPDSGLDHRERLVVTVLGEFMRPCGSCCFPGTSKIANRAAMSRNTVLNRLRSLRDAGWLSWLECRRSSGADSSRLYVPGVPRGSGLVLGGGET